MMNSGIEPIDSNESNKDAKSNRSRKVSYTTK